MKIEMSRISEDKEYCEKLFKHYTETKVLREEKNPLFLKHLQKSISNLDFANFILDEHYFSIKEKLPNKKFYDWCITIYYYSIYHSTLALLAKSGYSSKSHLATITTITLFYFHEDNILNKKEIEFLIDKIHLEKSDIDLVLGSKDLRERACYGIDETFELTQAKNLQKQTADFIQKIRNILSENPPLKEKGIKTETKGQEK